MTVYYTSCIVSNASTQSYQASINELSNRGSFIAAKVQQLYYLILESPINYVLRYIRLPRWLSGSLVRICLPMQETLIWSLSGDDPLKKETATHSSILAWEILWTEEPGRLYSIGSQRVRHDLATNNNNNKHYIKSYLRNYNKSKCNINWITAIK